MKVLVVASNMDCLSEVSSPRSSLPSIDRAPVEEAIRLRENGGADEVVIVAIGDVEARIMLRLALGMGADRAILVQTEDWPSPEETSVLLTAVAKRECPDLILLGRSASQSLARISPDSGNGFATARVSNLAQGDCRYPTLIQIRTATTKTWDIIAAAELRRLYRQHQIAPQSRTTSLTG
jgi:electron transfer flavoprotein alpha/beta subunit